MGKAPRADIIYGFSSISQGSVEDGFLPYDPDTYATLYEPYDFGEDGWPAEYKRRTDGKDVEESGCIIGIHGYSDDPGYYVGIKASHISGDWDSETTLNPEHFATMHSWDAKLAEFCKVMDIPYQQPKWIMLCSDD